MNQNFQILIVDSDSSFALNMHEILCQEGHYVAIAEDGQTALALCHETEFDLAIVDAGLPDISALELVPEMVHIRPDLEAVLLTGKTAVQTVGCRYVVGYQSKPVDIDAFLAFIRQVMSRKRATQALRENETRFQVIFESVTDTVIHVDMAGNILAANIRTTDICGYCPEELIGRNFAEFDFLSRDSSKEMFGTFDEIRRGRVPRSIEIEISHKDGHKVLASISPRLLKQQNEIEGILLIIRDITQQKRFEKDLQQSEERFSKAYQSRVNLMAFSTLEDGRFIDVNDGFLETLGFEKEEVIGRTSRELNIFVDYTQRELVLEAVKNQGFARNIDVTVRTRNGDIRYGSFSADIVQLQDQQCMLTVMSDVTERKSVEEALRHRNMDLNFLNSMAKSLAESATVDEVLQAALGSATEAIGMPYGSIRLLDDNTGILALATHNIPEIYRGLSESYEQVPIDTDFASKVIATGMVTTSDDYSHGRWIKDLSKAGFYALEVESAVSIPLKSGNRVLGVMTACSSIRRGFIPDDIRLMETIGGDVGIAIEKARLLEQMSALSITDEVTGLYNRRNFYDVLEGEISRMQSNKSALSVALLDLDGFKEYNDRFGHTNGDAVLKEFALTLRSVLKNSEKAFRFGGDEFVITLPSTIAEEARQVLERVRAQWLRVTGDRYSASQVPLMFSAGVAQFPEDAETIDGLLFLADAALYHSKRTGSSHPVKAADLKKYTSQKAMRAMDEHVYALAAMVDAKDAHTYGHSARVAAIADLMGRSLGLSQKDLANLRSASLLHDIGKVGVPDIILGKDDKLTETEWELMKQHAAEGAKIVGHIGALKALVPMILHHHEWFDGSGYPDGLSGKKIPLGARIISVADAYETMRTRRPYRMKVSHEAAIQDIRRLSGTQFDPKMVDALCGAMDGSEVWKFIEIP